jgi:hypothetical protein
VFAGLAPRWAWQLSTVKGRPRGALVECIRAKTARIALIVVFITASSPETCTRLLLLKYDAKSKKRQGLLQY